MEVDASIGRKARLREAQGTMRGTVRPATEEEAAELVKMFVWPVERPILLFETGDMIYVISQDDEGNGPGALVEVWSFEDPQAREGSLERRGLGEGAEEGSEEAGRARAELTTIVIDKMYEDLEDMHGWMCSVIAERLEGDERRRDVLEQAQEYVRDAIRAVDSAR